MQTSITIPPDQEDHQYLYCLRCGKRLVSVENKQRGMGKVCWEKSKIEKIKKAGLLKE